MVKAVFDNLTTTNPKNHFTVGIVDDVTQTSLDVQENLDIAPEGLFSAKFFGLGSDGTVGANQNSIRIIGDETDMYAQGYFEYDSKKSGGITISHLRFGHTPIKAPYLVSQPNLVACHNPSYVTRYDLLDGIKEGGVFLLNSLGVWKRWKQSFRFPQEDDCREELRFYNIDAVKIAAEIGLGGRVNTILQASFFQIANVIPPADALGYIKEAILKSYGDKGEKVVNMNYAAVDSATSHLVEINYPASWANATEAAAAAEPTTPFVDNVVRPVQSLKGNSLPVSAFAPDGLMPTGTTAYETVLPLMYPSGLQKTASSVTSAPLSVPMRSFVLSWLPRKTWRMPLQPLRPSRASGGMWPTCAIVSDFSLDCTGCGNCAQVCPAKEKPWSWSPLRTMSKCRIKTGILP